MIIHLNVIEKENIINRMLRCSLPSKQHIFIGEEKLLQLIFMGNSYLKVYFINSIMTEIPIRDSTIIHRG